jgi:DNA gyrase subunit A
VREHQELVFISLSGMVQRTSVRGISKMGRPTQGVRVMNLRGDDVVSAVALVVETDATLGAEVSENGDAPTLEDGVALAAEDGVSGDADFGDVDSGDADESGDANGSSNGSADSGNGSAKPRRSPKRK